MVNGEERERSMSCNGCRVLRKGCAEGCALRPCLEWIERPEAQGFATLFLAKFFGRAGLLEFITAVPLSQRTALFQSLLYEACGRTVNPVYGAVGLLWSGKWHLCQEAVETVLNGGNLHTNIMCNHDTISHNLGIINPNSIANVGSIGGSQTILPSRASHSSLFKVPSISFHAQSGQRPNVACKPSISTPGFHSLEEKLSFNYAHKKLKISSENLESRSLVFQSRPREGVIACNYTTNTMHQHNMLTSCSHTMVHQRSEPQCCKIIRRDADKYSSTIANEEVHLALALNSNKKRGAPTNHKEDIVNGRVSSPSEGSIVTSLGSPLLPSTSCHHLPNSPSSRSHQDMKLLNLLV